MKPTIVELPEKKFVGMRMRMSHQENLTPVLFRSFMPRHKEIKYALGNGAHAIHIYDQGFQIQGFSITTVFEKWAAMEVSQFEPLSTEMEQLIIPSGKYALFIHKGLTKDFPKTNQYIYTEWLPQSGYTYDDRPYFERMGENYFGPNDPNSEEEIYIPIR